MSAFAGQIDLCVFDELFLQIAAVDVDHVVSALDDLAPHEVGNPVGVRTRGVARKRSADVLAVERVEVGREAVERRHVDARNGDDGTPKLVRIDPPEELLDCFDPVVFRAVDARDDSEGRAVLRSTGDRDRDENLALRRLRTKEAGLF